MIDGGKIYQILCLFGAVTCIGITVMGVVFIFHNIKDLVEELHWRRKFKHRFDDPPTAKCYCRDCNYHMKSGECTLPGITRYTPDNGFCYEAEPITIEIAKRRGEMLK